MKKVLLSTLFLVIVGGVAVAQQQPADAKKQVEMPKHVELPKNKKAERVIKNDTKTAEQKKLEQAAKAEAAKNKKPVAVETKSEADN